MKSMANLCITSKEISEVMFNLLDSHDTERILWTANEDVQLVKSALAFLFLQKEHPASIMEQSYP